MNGATRSDAHSWEVSERLREWESRETSGRSQKYRQEGFFTITIICLDDCKPSSSIRSCINKLNWSGVCCTWGLVDSEPLPSGFWFRSCGEFIWVDWNGIADDKCCWVFIFVNVLETIANKLSLPAGFWIICDRRWPILSISSKKIIHGANCLAFSKSFCNILFVLNFDSIVE